MIKLKSITTMNKTNFLIKKAQRHFQDSLVIRVRGGRGGTGLPNYGGIGGKGGNVIIKACDRVKSLSSLIKKSPDGLFVAGDGEESRRTRLVGRPGYDLNLKVPVGITVEDSSKQFLGDLNKPNEEVVVAYGGRGGDKFSDNHGFRGQYKTLRLDFKTIADMVFVGFPNAGKSSLLRAVSNAVPKVADYPFTTLRPHLGIVNYNDYRRITMADLPGLVEGASRNLGLGHDFLKHIVRAKVLVFVIDINNVDLGPSYPKRSPLETMCILNKEIEIYDDTLLEKPSICVISKMDTLVDAEERYAKFKEDLENLRQSRANSQINTETQQCQVVDPNLVPSKLLDFDEILALSSEKRLNIEHFKKVARDTMDKYSELGENQIKSYEEIMHLDTNRLIST